MAFSCIVWKGSWPIHLEVSAQHTEKMGMWTAVLQMEAIREEVSAFLREADRSVPGSVLEAVQRGSIWLPLPYRRFKKRPGQTDIQRTCSLGTDRQLFAVKNSESA